MQNQHYGIVTFFLLSMGLVIGELYFGQLISVLDSHSLLSEPLRESLIIIFLNPAFSLFFLFLLILSFIYITNLIKEKKFKEKEQLKKEIMEELNPKELGRD